MGVILYRLLTDEYPFAPQFPLPLLYERIEEVDPKAPEQLNPRAPRSVSELAMRLLSKRPEERGASAREVYEALRAAMADGDARWDDFLFEWDDGPSTHSRSTEETEFLGPAAPGHEVALMHASAQRLEQKQRQRRQRALRKRPRPAEPVSPAHPTVSTPGRGRPGRSVCVGCIGRHLSRGTRVVHS